VIGRRHALSGIVTMLVNAWAVVSCAPRSRPRSGDVGQVPPATTASDNHLGDEVLKDLTRLGSRVYSEEGIAVFLACENLARRPDGTANALPAPTALNTSLAATFRKYAEVLPRVRPEVVEGDVAKLVELLADRDFTAGGTGVTR